MYIQELENSYIAAKGRYSKSLRELENISEDIHRKRNQSCPAVFRANIRNECVGSERNFESSKPRRLSRQLSEDCSISLTEAQRIRALAKQRSFLLDLDGDFDIDTFNAGTNPKSPSTKSVDMGSLSSAKYYTDYQLLDVKKLFDPEWRRITKPNLLCQTSDVDRKKVLNINRISNKIEKHLPFGNKDRRQSSRNQWIFEDENERSSCDDVLATNSAD